MKLYYDMLVPFIPNSTQDEKTGELVFDAKLDARRQAMIELSNFQRTGNGLFLTQAVVSACKFAGVDTVSTILAIPKSIDFPEDSNPIELIDDAVTMLFSSLKNEFDIYAFTATLLMALHCIMISNATTDTKD